MSSDDREVFKVRRDAGLQKRHEQRLENATYTAAEVKVLTEAALRLGRKEAGEEIARMLEERATIHSNGAVALSLRGSAIEAREIGSRPSPDAPSAQTDPSGYSDLPQDSQAGREAKS